MLELFCQFQHVGFIFCVFLHKDDENIPRNIKIYSRWNPSGPCVLLVGIDEFCEICIAGELCDHLNSLGLKDQLMDCKILWLHGSSTAIVSRSTNIEE